MNTASISGPSMAMDSIKLNSSSTVQKSEKKAPPKDTFTLPKTAAEVTANYERNKADIESNVQELQRLSDIITGHKLTFNVNKDLNKVVIKVVNSSTDEVIREIPSEDLQKIQIRMKQAIGVLFDELI